MWWGDKRTLLWLNTELGVTLGGLRAAVASRKQRLGDRPSPTRPFRTRTVLRAQKKAQRKARQRQYRSAT